MARPASLVRLLAVLLTALALAGATAPARFALAEEDPSLGEQVVAAVETAEATATPEESEATAAPAEGESEPSAESLAEVVETEEPTVPAAPTEEPPPPTDEGAGGADGAAAAADFAAQQAVQVTLTKTDDQGNPLGAACFIVFEALPGGALGDPVFSTCTNEFGQIVFNLEPGDYVLVEDEAPNGFLPIANVPFTVLADTPMTLGPFVDQPTGGNAQLTVNKTDNQGAPLEGACFQLYQDLAPAAGTLQRGALVFAACDETSGALVFSRFQTPGNYILVESTTPPGFVTSTDVEFTLAPLQVETITVVNVPAQGNESGDIVVTKRDPFQDLLLGACWEIFADTDPVQGEFAAGTQVGSEVCDDDDGLTNGVTIIADVPPGQYVLVESVAPIGFEAADDREVIVVPGQATNLTVTDQPLPEQSGFVFTKTFEGTPPPAGSACFAFFVDLDPDEGEIDLGEELAGGCADATGHVLSRNQAPGDYVAVETTTPDGYRTMAPVEFSIAGEREVVEIEVLNELADPTDPATLLIHKEQFVSGETDVPLAGACFRLFENDGGLRGDPAGDEVCDGDDGADDGLISIPALAGTYALVETVVPPGFDFAVDRLVTLEAGQVTVIEVTNLPGTGLTNVTVFKVDENGDGLGGACFELRADAGGGQPGALLLGPACSNDVDGFVFQDTFAAGSYVLVETDAPDGYQAAANLVFTHQANFNTVLIVENEPVAAPTATATATTAPAATAAATATTAVTELPSTGTGGDGDGRPALALLLALAAIGATGWGLRRALRARSA